MIKINNKGFASTLTIYSMLLLIVTIMFLILGILNEQYTNQKEYIDDIETSLEECLNKGEC